MPKVRTIDWTKVAETERQALDKAASEQNDLVGLS